MNATALGSNMPTTSTLFQRFWWKEYRMLRGFWLAVAALGLLAQLAVPLFTFNREFVPGHVFVIAWAAAALYAVGCAVTLFSAEREENTHNFLMHLPNHWGAMFAGKVALAIVSAVLLASALSITGWLTAGAWPSRAIANETLGVAGVAIIEATVWGLFFSLWMNQPLLAAIVSMAAASFGAQLAVAVSSPASQAFVTAAYAQAVPLRLLLCGVVFLVDVKLASRWLQPAGHASSLSFGERFSRLASTRAKKYNAVASIASQPIAARPRRRRQLVRLLWQTWRESWKTMLAAVPIALLLMVSVSMAGWILASGQLSNVLTALFLPAIFGALVFRADQRDGHRQFLITHAGRARYVWLARHAVWLTSLICLGLLVQLAGTLLTAYGVGEQLEYALKYQFYPTGYLQSAWSSAWQLQVVASTYWTVSTLGWTSMLAAYGLGQLCSMALRREVLAGFLALLLSTLLTVWMILVGVWQLSGWWFVLPIFAGSMFATWLRAPNWMLGRRPLRGWLTPVAALAATIACVAFTLPYARQAQLPDRAPLLLHGFLREPLDKSLARTRDEKAEATRNSANFEQIYTTLISREEAGKDVQIDGKHYEEYDLETPILGENTAYGGRSSMEFGAHTTTSPLSEEQELLLERFRIAQNHAYALANQAAVDQLRNLSQSDKVEIPKQATDVGRRHWNIFTELVELLLHDASRLQHDADLDAALQNHLAAMRILGQLLDGYDATAARDLIGWHEWLRSGDQKMLRWAEHPEQTSERIVVAIQALQEIFEVYPEPRKVVLGDYHTVRDIVLDKQPPTSLQGEHASRVNYLPYLQNMLPWERERAVQSLRLLTTSNLNYVDAVRFVVRGGQLWNHQGMHKQYPLSSLLDHDWDHQMSSRFEPLCEGSWERFVQMQQLLSRCKTSFLVAEELRHRGDLANYLIKWIDSQIHQRALLTQLALIAYRRDHEEYPETLESLTPTYLRGLPLDPYTQKPFEYRKNGLDLPLYMHLGRTMTVSDLREQPSIAAGTPLLWSVGVNEFTLIQEQVTWDHFDSEHSSEWKSSAKASGTLEYQMFSPKNPHARYHPNLVFTLPTESRGDNKSN